MLRDAVDRSHSPNERLAVDRDDSSIRKDALKSFNRPAIVRMAKYRSEYDAVGDVEVCVARRKTIEIAGIGARATDDARHW